MNTEVVVVEKEIEESKTDASRIIAEAKRLASLIVDNESCGRAADYMLEIKRVREKWEDFWSPICAKSREAWKEVVGKRDQVLESLDRPEKEILKPAIRAFYVEQERKREAEERRLMEEQRKRDDDARLKAAAELEKAGEPEAAERVMNQPPTVVPVVLPKEQKAEGISMVEYWKFRIKDANAIPREYLAVDEVKIGKVVRAMKGNTNIPGIEVYVEKDIKGRTR